MTKTYNVQGVLSLLFEFLLSALVLVGCYFGYGAGIPGEVLSSVALLVVAFWFNNRRDEKRDAREKDNIDKALKANPPKEDE